MKITRSKTPPLTVNCLQPKQNKIPIFHGADQVISSGAWTCQQRAMNEFECN